jgi:MFS family permease
VSLLSYKQAVLNERYNYAEILLITPFIVIVQQFAPVLATRLGASPLLLGFLTSGAALMLAITAAMGPWWFSRIRLEMRSLAVPLILFRTVLFWLPLVLLLPAYRAEALVALIVILNFFAGLSQVTFVSFLPRMTLRHRLAGMVSGRWTALGIGMAVTAPLLAIVLDRFPLPLNYAIVCAIAIVFTIASMVFLFRIKLSPLTQTETHKIAGQSGAKNVLSHAPGMRYLIVTLLVQLALNAPIPLITLRLVRELNVSDGDFGIYAAVFWAALAAFGLLMPWLVERIGNRKVFVASGVGLALQVLLLALTSSLPLIWLAGAIGGVASVMFQVTSFALVVESAPPSQYEHYVSIHSSVANFAVFAAPLAMSALNNVGLPIVTGLLICAAARLVAGLPALRSQTVLHPPASGSDTVSIR